jgi:sugar lactone lactonase YvrE
MDAGEMEVFADGLTTISSLTFDNDGNLLVGEFRGDLMIFSDPTPGRVLRWMDGSWEVVADGLVSPTGLAVGLDDTIYIAQEFLGSILAVRWVEGGTPPPPPDGPTIEVVASGLDSPRGIAIDDDGMLYVAQAGVGGEDCIMYGEGEEASERCFGATSSVSMIMDGVAEDIISGINSYLFSESEFLGAQDVFLDDDGTVYGLVGLGADPALREAAGDLAAGLGTLVTSDGEGGWEVVYDLAAYEVEANPDGGLIDSNPFQAVITDDGIAFTDAGANALNWIDNDGEISTLAAFPDTMADAPPFLELPPGTQIPMQFVPTGLALGPDGAWYVGQLTGFPFVPGAAKVWRVAPGEEPEVYAEGFTNIVSIDFDSDGNLWVLEIAAGGILNFNPEDMSTFAGALHKVSPDGAVEEMLSDGLVVPAGLAVGPDDEIYISNYGLMPGMGTVIKVTWD